MTSSQRHLYSDYEEEETQADESRTVASRGQPGLPREPRE